VAGHPLSDFRKFKWNRTWHDRVGSPAYRAVQCSKYQDTVFVLHASTKTTNGVDRAATKTVDERFKAMMKEVNARKKQKKK